MHNVIDTRPTARILFPRGRCSSACNWIPLTVIIVIMVRKDHLQEGVEDVDVQSCWWTEN